jgi:putative ABC transport system substrate-binding protein
MVARRLALFLTTAVLVAGLTGACTAGIGTSPSTPPVPRVGLMHVGTDHVPPSLETLVGGLIDLGWLDGDPTQVTQLLVHLRQIDSPKIELLWRNLDKKDVVAQAQEFVNEHVDVIVAFEDKSISAAQEATAKAADRIPVVFLHPSDPVRDGLVESLSHPGGNLTGVFGARDPVAKQLELYQQIKPAIHRLLTLVDPTDPTTPPVLAIAKDAAQKLGIELDIQLATSDDELTQVFSSLAPGAVDGAFILSPSLRLASSKKIIELATAANLPVQAHRKEWVEQGALFSLGVDVGPVGAKGARYVDSILRGIAPSDLPVEEVPRVEFAINLKRAGELGIQVPQDVVTRADVVYR